MENPVALGAPALTLRFVRRTVASLVLRLFSLSRYFCLAAAIVGVGPLWARAAASPPIFPAAMDASEVELAVKKLNVLGRVLYVAAHPDDENTNLIALWSNGSLYETAYLSITRGDGGQNLIGPELRERLGVIRTLELLAARRVDHGQQFFTRANDFGFSKTAEETLHIWDHDKILSDVVWVIRRFRPDVIVTRFSPDDRLTHGHHTASAILAQEAFAASADPKRFPEQLKLTQPWQPVRLVWNTSPFFFSNRNIPFDHAGLTTMEAGGFNPLLGKAYTEIAAASVSMHKSQGVGSPPRRGARTEYFKPLLGPEMKGSVFNGVDTSWRRVPQAQAVAAKIEQVIKEFNPQEPAASVSGLLDARKALEQLKEDDWGPLKRAELDQAVAACLGLYVESSTNVSTVTPGQTLPIKLEAINRAGVGVKIKSIAFPGSSAPLPIDAELPRDQFFSKDFTPMVPTGTPYSQPYWLRHPGTIGTYTVDDQELIGLPQNPPHFPAQITFEIGGQEIGYTLDTKFRTVDPVAGELRHTLVIAPPAFANFSDSALIFPDPQPKNVNVRILSATAAGVKGSLKLTAPTGWSITPASIPLDLQGAESETDATFTVKPPDKAKEGTLTAVISTGGADYSFSRVRISYPHIGVHVLMPAAESKLVRADIKTRGRVIGYVPGAGDEIPQALEQIGYAVKILGDADLTAGNLKQFSAVVLGVRLYDTNDRITTLVPQLLEYVKQGGVVVAQYNTTAGLKTKEIGPFPLEISRERVTDEKAEVRVLAPDHPVMNSPNKISAKDFEGWVQERGLYFPNKWDPGWTPILSCHDPNEQPMDGGLLVAKSGKGYFVYTGYSWFRQLPAGVPGAYRVFANLVSLGGQ
ncbi:MAG: PIG-L family deacetylase [Chthoniobacterales bacterium]